MTSNRAQTVYVIVSSCRLVVLTHHLLASACRFVVFHFFFGYSHKRNAHGHVVTSEHVYCFHVKKINLVEIHRGVYANVVRTELGSALLHTLFTHFIFFFLQQNNLDYVDPQIANLLFEAGQSSTNIGYNI